MKHCMAYWNGRRWKLTFIDGQTNATLHDQIGTVWRLFSQMSIKDVGERVMKPRCAEGGWFKAHARIHAAMEYSLDRDKLRRLFKDEPKFMALMPDSYDDHESWAVTCEYILGHPHPPHVRYLAEKVLRTAITKLD